MPNPEIDKIKDIDAGEEYAIKNTNTWRGVKFNNGGTNTTLLDTEPNTPAGDSVIFSVGDNMRIESGPTVPGIPSPVLIFHATDTKPEGYVGNITAAGESVAHGTSWTTLLHVDITPGIYIVSWAASFASNGGTNTGYRGAGIATTGEPFAYMSSQVPAVTNNTYTLVSGSALHKTTTNQTLNLKVRQYSSAGTNLTVTPRLQIIKIA